MVEQESYEQEELEMVRQHSQAIESKSLCVLEIDFDKLQVCMKGRPADVRDARQQVHTLIMGKEILDDAKFKEEQIIIERNKQWMHSVPLISSSSDCSRINLLQESSGSALVSVPRDADNNFILDSESTSDRKEFDFSRLSHQPDCTSDFTLIARGTAAVQDRTLVICDDDIASKGCQSSSSSSTDSDLERIMSDPLYVNKLEYAMKLGYSETALCAALHKLGTNCDENQLLKELIEHSKGTVEEFRSVDSLSDDGLDQTISPSLDLCSEEFLGIMRKVNKSDDGSSNLHHIVIDGSNVAMSHGKNVFSCRGIKIAVDWFRQRGHKDITVFVPQWRKETSRPDAPIIDQDILTELESQGILVFTPARRIKGRRVVCYDDRFVLKLAVETNGIVVSNDNYRDLLNESQEFRTVVDERLLMYTFVNDRFMPPEDPLGRRGPTLDNFLRKEPTNPPPLPPDCPYGRKCTYGNKCKYYHPERGSQPHKSVSETLKEQASLKMQERAIKGPDIADKGRKNKAKLMRTRSLIPGDALPGDKSALSPLPSALQEPDANVSGRQKSPSRSSGKTADYLSEHRKILEKAIAMDKALNPSSESVIPVSKHQETRSQDIVSNIHSETLMHIPSASQLLPQSHLNVPYSDNQEGKLVRGHLLLAKKLSDETADTAFFSNEGSSNRSSPLAVTSTSSSGPGRRDSLLLANMPEHNSGMLTLGLNRQTSLAADPSTQGVGWPEPLRLTKRRMSQQDQHQQLWQHLNMSPAACETDSSPDSYLSGPFQHNSSFLREHGYSSGVRCQSFPTSEKETAHILGHHLPVYSNQMSPQSVPGGLRTDIGYTEHLPMKPLQQGCPPPTQLYSSQSVNSLLRQNSTSDPQIHISADSNQMFQPVPIPTPPISAFSPQLGHPGYFSPQKPPQTQAQVQARQNFLRSSSVQCSFSQPAGLAFSPLDRQMSEIISHTQDPFGSSVSSSAYSPRWDMGSQFLSHPTSPSMFSSHGLGGLPSSGVSGWSQDPPRLPPPPVKGYSLTRPITPADPRYSTYYHLCGIFPERRVREVMNRFPDETDPQKLCLHLVQMR